MAIGLVAAFAAGTTPLGAQTPGGHGYGDAASWPVWSSTSGPLGVRADDEHFHPNHAAVVVGGMTPLSETSETSFALGADYERRFSPAWGAGVGVDLTFGDHKRTVLAGGAVTFRPTPALRLLTGPGFEVAETDTSSGATKNKVYFVWGFGAFYEFHIGPLAIGPNVIVDFLGETKTNLTYGIAVGAGF